MCSIQQESASLFESAEYIPADAIFEVTKDYLADTDPDKVNLGQGTYRDENGKPWILPSVRMATEKVAGCGHEYLPIAGLSSFRKSAFELVFQGTKAFQEGRIAACQSLSGTSALQLAGLAIKRVSAEPTRAEAVPIFDSAYLGFNSGSVDEDAWAIRYFVDTLGLEASICLLFAKSMGLYGERIGLVTFVAKSPGVTHTVNSILENVQRATVSSPPVYGAQIAAAMLGTPEITKQWAEDLITMSSRIKSTRQKLFDELVRLGTPGDWSHIINQSGMFGYRGISPVQIKHLQAKYHIYMADTSRISIAGLNYHNVGYFAKTIDQAIRFVK